MIRVLYTKIGDITYISHLDIVKLMERISRRAGVRLAYSQGFSPHPKTAFSPALSVGMNSFCEYLDIELEDETIDEDELLKRYNEASVNGIRFEKAKKMQENTKSIASFITHSIFEFDFEYYLDENIKSIKNTIEYIKNEEEILLTRTSKSGNEISYNIKDMINEIYIKDKILVATISTSSAQNLNPRALLSYILEKSDIIQDEVIRITKKDTFNMSDDGIIIRPI